jgi:hypothetical protein
MLTKNTIFATAGIALLFVAGTAVAGPSVESWQVRGHGAYAVGYGDDGCVSHWLAIGAADEVFHQRRGAPVAANGAWLYYASYDRCTGREIWGWTEQADSNFTGALGHASISVTFEVELYEWRPGPYGWELVMVGTETVDVSVYWTGIGDVISGVDQSMSRWGNYFFRSRWLGRFREAEVSIDVALGGVPLLFDAAWGNLGRYNAGSTTVYHY